MQKSKWDNGTVFFNAYSFFVRHRYLRFENLNLSYISKTLELKKTCNPKRYRKPTQS